MLICLPACLLAVGHSHGQDSAPARQHIMKADHGSWAARCRPPFPDPGQTVKHVPTEERGSGDLEGSLLSEVSQNGSSHRTVRTYPRKLMRKLLAAAKLKWQRCMSGE